MSTAVNNKEEEDAYLRKHIHEFKCELSCRRVNMARPLQLLSLLSRFGALSAATAHSCRFASRSTSRTWMDESNVSRHRASNRASRYSDETFDGDDGLDHLEDVEDKLQTLIDAGRKRQKTVKFHILRRQMTPSGAPQRKLTWDAIKQIRYLKQQQPEEWTVERLAEGFSVTPDVILRVLRSKFLPSPERKTKQDAKVMAELNQQVMLGKGQGRKKLPESCPPATLVSGNREGALVPVTDHILMTKGEGLGSLAKSSAHVTLLPSQFTTDIRKDATVTEDNITTDTNATEEDDGDSWDGHVLTEEELEELIEMEKPSPVVQVGKDFLDAEGNFLYRI